MSEEWRIVARAPLYQVSNLGRVRRIAGYRCLNGRILKLRNISDGYLAAHLSVNGKKFNGPVHQLVCEAFHGPKPEAHFQVAHADGDPMNNCASNLRWATVAENAEDRRRHGTLQAGERNGRAKLSDLDVAAIRQSTLPAPKIAEVFGVSRTHVWRIRSFKNRITDLRHEAEAA